VSWKLEYSVDIKASAAVEVTLVEDLGVPSSQAGGGKT
jgi:hypothetical protein